MPRDGDRMKAYCSICGTETTHVYHGKWTEEFWLCLGCGAKKGKYVYHR